MSPDEISQELLVTPSEVRTVDDWPQSIKRLSDVLPAELQPRYSWTLTTEYVDCMSVDIPCKRLLFLLSGKDAVINSLEEKFNLQISVVISIQSDTDTLPEMVIAKEFVEFLGNIHAELSFDMYIGE